MYSLEHVLQSIYNSTEREEGKDVGKEVSERRDKV